MAVNTRRPWFRRTELLLLLVGVLCFGYLLRVWLKGEEAQRESQAITSVKAAPAEVNAASAEPAMTEIEAKPKASGVIGRLEIQKLGLSVPILSNYDPDSLQKGVGHIPGTAMPGGLGTLGLAGHRDTYFKPLRGIKQDMDIRVSDETGVYHYQVDSTEIVTPDAVRVLDIQSRPELTLITCYPFSYIGAAPKRFIVHAHLLSAMPDES